MQKLESAKNGRPGYVSRAFEVLLLELQVRQRGFEARSARKSPVELQRISVDRLSKSKSPISNKQSISQPPLSSRDLGADEKREKVKRTIQVKLKALQKVAAQDCDQYRVPSDLELKSRLEKRLLELDDTK